jgi:hypothetical protein
MHGSIFECIGSTKQNWCTRPTASPWPAACVRISGDSSCSALTVDLYEFALVSVRFASKLGTRSYG